MSDILYNEVPGYRKGDWKDYAIHDDKNIKGLFGDYRFMSNFELYPVIYQGIEYPSSEHAYQAQKLKDIEDKKAILPLTSGQAKKFHLNFPKEKLVENWESIKLDVMRDVLIDKFTRHEELKQKLIDTGDKYIEETNAWKDQFYGVYYKTGEGQNNLGKLLMWLRDKLKKGSFINL